MAGEVETTICRAAYCWDSVITKSNPGTNVPEDPELREQWLLRGYQTAQGSTSHHTRVEEEVADAKARIAQKKRPKRIRFHKSHFPPGSFFQGPKNEVLKDKSILPFGVKEHLASLAAARIAERKRKAEEEEKEIVPLPEEQGDRAARVKQRRIAKVDPVETLAELQQKSEVINILRGEVARARKGGKKKKTQEAPAAPKTSGVLELQEEIAALKRKIEELEKATVPKLTWDSVCASRSSVLPQLCLPSM